MDDKTGKAILAELKAIRGVLEGMASKESEKAGKPRSLFENVVGYDPEPTQPIRGPMS